MTPTEHNTQAETMMSAQPAVVTDAYFQAATVHAILGQAAGTGASYTTADDLLDEAETLMAMGERGRISAGHTLREALVYAHLATRA